MFFFAFGNWNDHYILPHVPSPTALSHGSHLPRKTFPDPHITIYIETIFLLENRKKKKQIKDSAIIKPN